MSRLPSFLFGAIVGAGLMHLGTNNHVVRAQDGFHLVGKTRPRVAEVYVDIRNFGVSDWSEHKELALAITQAGKQQLITGQASSFLENGVNQTLQGFGQPSYGQEGYQPQGIQ